MATPYLGEIRLFSSSKIPRGWAQCNGQLLSVNQNKPLFSLLGTAYGGDGTTNFALPDLRGRAPIHIGKGYNLGNNGGEATHALAIGEMPSHTHLLTASSSNASAPSPSGNLWAVLPDSAFAPLTSQNTSLSPASLANTGINQGHDNMAPYLALNFCIAIAGIFPSRT
jgi:microcystin-dependent protein